MARQREHRDSIEKALLYNFKKDLDMYRQELQAEKIKENPDDTKVGVWQAKIDYYERKMKRLPERMRKIAEAKTDLPDFMQPDINGTTKNSENEEYQ